MKGSKIILNLQLPSSEGFFLLIPAALTDQPAGRVIGERGEVRSELLARLAYCIRHFGYSAHAPAIRVCNDATLVCEGTVSFTWRNSAGEIDVPEPDVPTILCA